MPVIDQVPPYGRIWFTSFRDSLNGLGGGPLNIYSTTDGGRTWTMELDTFAGFTQVYFERGVPGLALSRSRGTVYVRSTGTSAVRESAAARPIRHLPSNALEVTPGSSGKVIVTVADVRGAVRVRRVQSAVAGSPLYLDLNGLPPGFYVVSVTGNGESAVGKVAIAP